MWRKYLSGISFIVFLLSFMLQWMLPSNMAYANGQTIFRLGTGKASGVYYRVDAAKIAQQLDQRYIKMEIIPEKNGTPELVEKIKRGEIDGAIIQFDGLVNESTDAIRVVNSLHDEFFYMLTLKESKIDKVSDLTDKDTISIGMGGAAMTWKNFCKEDSSYAKIPTVPTSGAVALSDLNGGKISAVVMMGGLKLGDIVRANEIKDKYKLVKVSDWSFDNLKFNKEKVYTFDKIDSDVFKNLIGWGSLKTLKTKAVFVVSTQWVSENEDLFDKIYDAVARAIPNIQKELIND